MLACKYYSLKQKWWLYALYQTVQQYCSNRDRPKMMRAAQKSAFKNCPRKTLCDQNHPYRTELVNDIKYSIYNKHILKGGPQFSAFLQAYKVYSFF